MSSENIESIEELAARYVMLKDIRPRALHWKSRSSAYDPAKLEARKAHMHEEYLLYEQILRRVGIDNTAGVIKQAIITFALLTPSP